MTSKEGEQMTTMIRSDHIVESVFIVEKEGVIPVAWAILDIIPPSPGSNPQKHNNRPYAIFRDFLVEENFRKHGIGTRILKTALEEAKKHRCYKVVLNTSKKELHNFYEKAGFRSYGTEFRLDIA